MRAYGAGAPWPCLKKVGELGSFQICHAVIGFGSTTERREIGIRPELPARPVAQDQRPEEGLSQPVARAAPTGGGVRGSLPVQDGVP